MTYVSSPYHHTRVILLKEIPTLRLVPVTLVRVAVHALGPKVPWAPTVPGSWLPMESPWLGIPGILRLPGFHGLPEPTGFLGVPRTPGSVGPRGSAKTCPRFSRLVQDVLGW